ncbi:unnamed protein product [Cylicostephanus goldi]|uniref:Uncharacterized protein n=1 Tax=Cylicostephanus goldi TaxID=71465 RepID=A0A3P6S1K5_CYLGO|nr:unnamed protein product [Cylicostephanus goldi]
MKALPLLRSAPEVTTQHLLSEDSDPVLIEPKQVPSFFLAKSLINCTSPTSSRGILRPYSAFWNVARKDDEEVLDAFAIGIVSLESLRGSVKRGKEVPFALTRTIPPRTWRKHTYVHLHSLCSICENSFSR